MTLRDLIVMQTYCKPVADTLKSYLFVYHCLMHRQLVSNIKSDSYTQAGMNARLLIDLFLVFIEFKE